MKYLFIIAAIVFIHVGVYSQDSTKVMVQKSENVYLGIGLGLDYGGIGLNYTHYIHNNFGFLVAAGYNLKDIGFNAGIKYRFKKKESTTNVIPFIEAMYGYTSAVKIENASQYDKTFYGPSIGGGIDWRSSDTKNFYWTAAIIVPLNSSKVNDYIDDLEQNHGVSFKTKPLPINFSIGLRFIL